MYHDTTPIQQSITTTRLKSTLEVLDQSCGSRVMTRLLKSTHQLIGKIMSDSLMNDNIIAAAANIASNASLSVCTIADLAATKAIPETSITDVAATAVIPKTYMGYHSCGNQHHC